MLDFISRIEGGKKYAGSWGKKRRINQSIEKKQIFVQWNLEKDKGTGSKEYLGIGIGSLSMLWAHT